MLAFFQESLGKLSYYPSIKLDEENVMHHESECKDEKGCVVNQDYAACIKACQTCAIDCEICLTAMLGQSSPNDCPLCCYECLEICIQCARALARGSRFAKEYCALCATVCEWCAEQCSQHNMDHCQRCADSCRVCADECRKMAH